MFKGNPNIKQEVWSSGTVISYKETCTDAYDGYVFRHIGSTSKEGKSWNAFDKNGNPIVGTFKIKNDAITAIVETYEKLDKFPISKHKNNKWTFVETFRGTYEEALEEAKELQAFDGLRHEYRIYDPS